MMDRHEILKLDIDFDKFLALKLPPNDHSAALTFER
jgi:hypothetical protein